MESAHKQKLYCYVDETGQDTKGQMFLVALVVTGNERDALIQEAERIEEASGKRLMKWRKTPLARKIAYLHAILSSPSFAGTLSYAKYGAIKEAYLDLMVYAVARAILKKAQGPYQATVIVDGLHKGEV